MRSVQRRRARLVSRAAGQPLLDPLSRQQSSYNIMGITIFTQIHVGDVIFNDIIIITVRYKGRFPSRVDAIRQLADSNYLWCYMYIALCDRNK